MLYQPPSKILELAALKRDLAQQSASSSRCPTAAMSKKGKGKQKRSKKRNQKVIAY